MGDEARAEQFPFRTITITSTTVLYQADCERCGWHTRQADSEAWVTTMAKQHFAICPNPYFRPGALMECGCWYYASPGESVGALASCPLHGVTLMAKANVDEHVPYGTGTWTPIKEVEARG